MNQIRVCKHYNDDLSASLPNPRPPTLAPILLGHVLKNILFGPRQEAPVTLLWEEGGKLIGSLKSIEFKI